MVVTIIFQNYRTMGASAEVEIHAFQERTLCEGV